MTRSLVLLALLASGSVSAQSWYVGLGVAGELDERVATSAGGHVDAENAGTVFVGTQFTQGEGFGAELAYVDLGTVREAGILDAGYDVDGELWSLGATYSVSLDAFEPYAKLGWFTREEDGVAITIAGPHPLEISDDGWMGEVGMRWRITDPFALRLGYVHYDFEPDADGSAQLAGEWRF